MGEEVKPAALRFTSRSATFIGSFTFAARIVERLGAFGQIVLIASVYGSGFLADRYFIASIVPLVLGAILGEALSANLLPALVRSETGRHSLIGGGFWLAAGVLVGVTAAYAVAATFVVHATAPAGSSDPGVWYAFAPIGPLLGLGGYLTGVLTYYERYVWPPFRSAVSTVSGLALTGTVVVFTHDLVLVAAAVSSGYALSLAALIVETRRVAGPGTFGPLVPAGVRAAAAQWRGLVSPVLGGLIGGQVFVLLERVLAATIAVGAVSTLSYARGLVFTPVIVAQSIALGLYPGMVRAFEADDLEHVRRSILRGLRLTLFLGLTLAVYFAAFASDMFAVFLEHGAFGAADARRGALALAAFAPALVASMLMVFLARVYYAVGYFRGVVWVQLAALLVYGVVAFPLRAVWGTSGLAFAFGVAEGAGACAGIALAARRVRLSLGVLVRDTIRPACVRAVPGAAALGLLRLVLDHPGFASAPLLRLGLALVLGLLVGGGALWCSGWDELVPLKRGLRRAVRV